MQLFRFPPAGGRFGVEKPPFSGSPRNGRKNFPGQAVPLRRKGRRGRTCGSQAEKSSVKGGLFPEPVRSLMRELRGCALLRPGGAGISAGVSAASRFSVRIPACRPDRSSFALRCSVREPCRRRGVRRQANSGPGSPLPSKRRTPQAFRSHPPAVHPGGHFLHTSSGKELARGLRARLMSFQGFRRRRYGWSGACAASKRGMIAHRLAADQTASVHDPAEPHSRSPGS